VGETSPTQYMEFLDIIDDVCAAPSCAVVDYSFWSEDIKERVGDAANIINDPVHLSTDGKDLLAEILSERILAMQAYQN